MHIRVSNSKFRKICIWISLYLFIVLHVYLSYIFKIIKNSKQIRINNLIINFLQPQYQLNYMLCKQLKKYLQEDNEDKIIQIISSISFYANVTLDQLQSIQDIIQLKQINQHIKISLIALIVLKKKNQLQLPQQKLYIQYLTKIFKNSNLKPVISCILIRISNFLNYKMLINYLEPKLISIRKMTQVSSKLKEGSHANYEKLLIKNKQHWTILMNSLSFDLNELVKLMENIKIEENIDLFEIQNKIDEESNYLQKRIMNMTNQKLDLVQICNSIQKLITQAINKDPIENGQKIRLKNKIKQKTLNILNLLLIKIKRKFIRKFGWLLNLIEYNLLNISSFSSFVLNLTIIKNLYQIFGNGSFDLQQLLFQKQYCLYNLLDILFKRKEQQQQPKQQIQFRRQKKLNKAKAQDVKLDLFVKENVYQNFTKTITTKSQKEQLINTILQIIEIFYKDHPDCEHTAKLLLLIDFNISQMNISSLQKYCQIKQSIFPKSIIYSPNIQTIYEEILYQNIKKKRMNCNNIYKTEIITIYPKQESIVEKPFKKTVSVSQFIEKVQYEGWKTQSVPINIKILESKQKQKSVTIHQSELFYSFKDSKLEQGQQDDKKQDYFITPEF